MKHTLLPWTTVERGDFWHIGNEQDYSLIGRVARKPNAEIIVSRVNQGPKMDELLGIAVVMARAVKKRAETFNESERIFQSNVAIEKAREFLKAKENL